MLSLEKNHVVELNLLLVISSPRNQSMDSWVSQLPMLASPTAASLGFQDPAELLFQASNSQRPECALEPWSCQAQPRGGSSRIPSSEVSAPAAPLDTCPVLSAAAEVDFSLELTA